MEAHVEASAAASPMGESSAGQAMKKITGAEAGTARGSINQGRPASAPT